MVFCNHLKNYSHTVWKQSHNPYFNRWFSAIQKIKVKLFVYVVTILILIDGFLQLEEAGYEPQKEYMSQSLF